MRYFNMDNNKEKDKEKEKEMQEYIMSLTDEDI